MVPERAGTSHAAGSRGDGVGSVADETARLLEALLGPPPGPPPAAPAEPGPPPDPAQPSGSPPGAPSDGPPGGESCPTCGHPDPGAARAHPPADVCHLCPVCQVLRVVRSVRPETLDRLADLAAAVTESLRDAAAERWRTSGAADDTGSESSSPRPARPQVQDIHVVDDDGGADGSDPGFGATQGSAPLDREAPDPQDPQDLEDGR